MDLPPLYLSYEFTPIPDIFKSDATGEPFARCLVCDRHLLAEGERYIIEKAFRAYKDFDARDTVFEYALCLACRDQMSSELSKESTGRISEYFRGNVDFVTRRERLLRDHELEARPWLDRCLITGTPVDELEEVQVYCECDGEDMLFTYLPFAIGGPAMDEIAGLLSNATLDELRGFADDHLGVPPELEEIFTRRIVLI